jgi:hypothetical protein
VEEPIRKTWVWMEIGGSCDDWAQVNYIFLTEDGGRIRSPKRHVALIAVSRQRLSKHVPMAMDTHSEIEVLLEMMVYTRSV